MQQLPKWAMPTLLMDPQHGNTDSSTGRGMTNGGTGAVCTGTVSYFTWYTCTDIGKHYGNMTRGSARYLSSDSSPRHEKLVPTGGYPHIDTDCFQRVLDGDPDPRPFVRGPHLDVFWEAFEDQYLDRGINCGGEKFFGNLLQGVEGRCGASSRQSR